MASKDFYKILGVERNATEVEIKKAFRKLAKQYHPDVNPGNKQAEDKFKEITEAYAVLGDSDKRKQYDAVGPEGFQSGFDFSDFFRGGARPRTGDRVYHYTAGSGQQFNVDLGGLEDIFGSFFGMGRGAPEPSTRDVTHQLEIDFLTAARGGEVEISIHGERIRVKIPPGVDSGQVIRLAGKGERSRRGRGDLYVSLTVKGHHQFDRKQDDVYVEIPVTLVEACLGAKVEVPTIDGTAEVDLPAGTSSGQQLRLKGKGIYRRDGGRGDEFVRIAITVPKKLDTKSRSLLEEFARRNPEQPR